jgi:hypothetical protein
MFPEGGVVMRVVFELSARPPPPAPWPHQALVAALLPRGAAATLEGRETHPPTRQGPTKKLETPHTVRHKRKVRCGLVAATEYQ